MIDWNDVKQKNSQDFSRANLGFLNFSPVEPIIKNTISAFLRCENIVDISEAEKEFLSEAWTQYSQRLNQVLLFSLDDQKPHSEIKLKRDKLIQDVKFDSINIKQQLAGVYVFSDEAHISATVLSSQLQAKVNEAQNLLNNIQRENNQWTGTRQQELNGMASEVRSLRESAEKFTVQSIAEKHGSIFLKQARTHAVLAVIWLAALLGEGLLFYFYINKYFVPVLTNIEGILSTNEIIPSALTSFVILFIATRGAVAALFVGIMLVSTKNFNVNMNLFNINKHRENSLLSSNIMIKLSENDRELKSKIIEKVSDTIYSLQATGQISEGKKISISELTELIKVAEGK